MQVLKIMTSSNSNEHYTPFWCVELCREFLGTIDLDPASCEEANKVVKATNFYTKEQDGLSQEWWGKVFINPPRGTGKIGPYYKQEAWVHKLNYYYEFGLVHEGIVLLRSVFGYDWFNNILQKFPSCTLYKRLKFYNPDENGINKNKGADKVASTLVYVGPRIKEFENHFGCRWGFIL